MTISILSSKSTVFVKRLSVNKNPPPQILLLFTHRYVFPNLIFILVWIEYIYTEQKYERNNCFCPHFS